jgi:hypothetical protein
LRTANNSLVFVFSFLLVSINIFRALIPK